MSETETVDAWPFVVSRNRTLDWRPVIAPPFLIDAAADYLLVSETGGDATDPQVRHVGSASAGPVTLAFRRSFPTPDLLGGEAGSDPLRDQFGRPVGLVEGLLVRGHVDVSESLLSAALERVREQTRAVFSRFWDQDDESTPPISGSSFPLVVRKHAGGPQLFPLGMFLGAVAFSAVLVVRRIRRTDESAS